MSRQRLLSIVTLGTTVACILASFIAITFVRRMGEPNGPMQEFAEETTDRVVLESNAEVKIPPSATNVRGYITGFRELEILVRFEVNPTELQSFLDSTICDSALEAVPTPAQPAAQEVSWWDLHEAKALMYCSGGRAEFGQRVWVAKSSSNPYVVYVFAWTT